MTHDDLMKHRALALGDRSPTEVGLRKIAAALAWVYRWGWSSAQIIDALSGAQRRGLAHRLVGQKMLRATSTGAGGMLKGVPAQILTLTPLGLSEAERQVERPLPYRLDASRINQSMLRHDLTTQSETLKRIKRGQILRFETPAEFVCRLKPGYKQPDVIWILEDGRMIGIEIELTAKWARDLDQFVEACVKSLQADSGDPARLDSIGIFSDSEAILRRYKAALSANAPYYTWVKNDQGKWVRAKQHFVSDDSARSVSCFTIA